MSDLQYQYAGSSFTSHLAMLGQKLMLPPDYCHACLLPGASVRCSHPNLLIQN